MTSFGCQPLPNGKVMTSFGRYIGGVRIWRAGRRPATGPEARRAGRRPTRFASGPEAREHEKLAEDRDI